MSSLLLVEDDAHLTESLAAYLTQEGYRVSCAKCLAQARAEMNQGAPDVLVLDWMLPDGQGIDFLRELRAQGQRLPVLLLTSRVDLVDKVLGLESGANDYITKPFEPRELVARLRVQLRALTSAPSPILHGAGITLNALTREATFAAKTLELTKLEFELLKLLMENPGRVFPREALLNKVWGYESFPTTRTVDNHIVQLRQKTESSIFETVRGIGYRFRSGKND